MSRAYIRALTGAALLLAFAAPSQAAYRQPAAAPAVLTVLDRNGSDITSKGIALVDWDGYIANPAVKVSLKAPTGMAFPVAAQFAMTEPRCFFIPSTSVGKAGPRASLTFSDAAAAVPLTLSIFPNRGGVDQDLPLYFQLTDASGRRSYGAVNVHVFDQDREQPTSFKITLDYSYDKAGFFADPLRRALVQQAADDWAYFLDEPALDPVAAGAEKVWIFPPVTTFGDATLMPNPVGYTGFLMELYGVDNAQHRAGGEPSDQAFQSRGGTQLPLRRSGNVGFDAHGNWNTLGWNTGVTDKTWYADNNRGEFPNDLYSIAHHEMGHALFFNSHYPQNAMNFDKTYKSPELLAYHHAYPKEDGGDHLTGEIDDDSLRPAFGNEYNGSLPEGRWIITKLDLLCAETDGYNIRRTFDLALRQGPLPGSFADSRYDETLRATGGVPWYYWQVTSGALPDGLTLNRETGEITGVAMKVGNYTFTVQCSDTSAEKRVVQESYTISIT